MTFTMKLDQELHQQFKNCVKQQKPKETMTRIITQFMMDYVQAHRHHTNAD